MSKLTFWYEFASTYSYLSAMRIDDMAGKAGIEVEWKPFLLGPIFASQGWNTSPFAIYPAKGRNMWRDMERRCETYGIPFARPDLTTDGNWPRSSVTAARIAIVGLEEGWGKDFSKRVYTAEFSDHADISDETNLRSWITEAGGDADAAFAQIAQPDVKSKLRANTEAAMAAGIYGAPSFTFGEELFWGDDRLEDALGWAARYC